MSVNFTSWRTYESSVSATGVVNILIHCVEWNLSSIGTAHKDLNNTGP